MVSDVERREPAAGLDLRYGTYRVRYGTALALVFAGGVVLQLGSAYTLFLLTIGVAASIAGWIIVPAVGWRRCIAVVPAVLGVAALLAGAASGALIALSLGGWLLVRMRPLVAYSVLVLPIGAALLLEQSFPQYSGRVAVGAVLAVVVVGAAWLGRSLAAWKRPRFWAFFQREHGRRPLK